MRDNKTLTETVNNLLEGKAGTYAYRRPTYRYNSRTVLRSLTTAETQARLLAIYPVAVFSGEPGLALKISSHFNRHGTKRMLRKFEARRELTQKQLDTAVGREAWSDERKKEAGLAQLGRTALRRHKHRNGWMIKRSALE